MNHTNRKYRSSYNTKKRLASFGHQLEEVHKAKPSTILEIGIGSGLVSHTLAKDYNITTVDISKDLSPSCIGSVTHLPFKDGAFDMTLCCEVLEHLPFDQFQPALREIHRVSSKQAIISLPDKKPFFQIQLPYMRKRRLPRPFFTPPEHAFDGEHYWEINAQNHELPKIIQTIENNRFLITREYQVFENYKHHFFILNIQEA